MIDKKPTIDDPQQPQGTELGSPLEAYVRAMFTQMLTAMARSLRNDNLTLPQLAALHLVDQRGHMRIGELATELLIAMPTASRLTSELVKRGLMERREDEADRRAKSVTLSPAGYELIALISQQRTAESTAQIMHIERGPVHDRFMAFFAEIASSGLTRKQD